MENTNKYISGWAKLTHLLRTNNIWRDDRAGMMTMTAVMLPVLIGFVGLSIDASNWYMERRQVQNIADAGAVFGGHEILADVNQEELIILVNTFAEENGYTAVSDSSVVAWPPASGAYTTDDLFVEVIISRNVPLYFASILTDIDVTVNARAVAGGIEVAGDGCILALDNSSDRALWVTGTADISAGCGLISNSSSSSAISIEGKADVTASSASAFGEVYVKGAATLTTATPPQNFADKMPDPFDDLTIPGGTCNQTFNSGDVALVPGRYCGDMHFSGDVVLEPGTYIIDGGDISIGGSSTLNVASTGGIIAPPGGVTFILTGDTSADVGSVHLNSNAVIDLKAPTEGVYRGILFYQDPEAITSISNKNIFNGAATLKLDGAVYFPSQTVEVLGTADVANSCLQIVANKVHFAGTGFLNNDETRCGELGLAGFPIKRVQLVE